MFMPDVGLFRDLYDPQDHAVKPAPYRTKDNIGGRPLVEDAILVKPDTTKKRGDSL